MSSKILIDKQLSRKILTIGVSKSTNGGMASVLASYDLYFQNMRFIPTWKLSNKVIKAFYASRALLITFFLLLFDRRIEILHIHGAANASFKRKTIFIKLGKLFGKRVILHMHAADFEQYYENQKNKDHIIKTINQCDKLIVLSNSWAQYFNNIGVLKSNIEVLNNIVSPPQHISKQKENGKIKFLFLGEIGYRKGIFDLLKAISLNKEIFQEKIILRIGGNEVEGNIREFIKKNGLESFVLYEGWVSGNKKAECLNWADIYILPSYNEGLPIAILEAMSYSHPVISTNVGGIPDVVHSHVNGIIVEPGNLVQIKNALLFFIEHPESIKEFGANSYQMVHPYFPSSVFSHLESIYNSLLEE